MINVRLIFKVLGSLLFVESTLFLWSLIISFIYGEDDVFAFLISIVLTMFVGFVFRFIGRKADNNLGRRDAYLVVTLAWTLFSAFGCLPFLISGFGDISVTDAFFEMMSGFTTTGATIFDKVEILPHGLMFWRTSTQWIGGLGIAFFTLALLPSLTGGNTKVFSAEATGPIKTKLHPRLSSSARTIWLVYVILTIACLLCYNIAGMNLFDSLNYAMTSTATGGFSTHSDSTEYFNSPAMDYITTVFCFLSSVNFTLLYMAVARREPYRLFRSSEFRFFCSMVLICTAFIMSVLVINKNYCIEHAFRSALFQVVSFISTTGLFNDNAAQWPHVTWVVLAVCMFVGGMAGSTSGGFKCIRANMVAKITRNEFKRILHPSAVLPIKIDGTNIPMDKRVTLFAFFSIYVIMILVSAFIMIAAGVDNTNAITIALSSMGNVGPTLGTEIGPTMSWAELPTFAKWMCSFLMLVGRLEIFTVLVIFTPGFWKKV